MNKEELIQFLKENLSLEISEEHGFGEPDSINISIMLGNEEISKDYFNLPDSAAH